MNKSFDIAVIGSGFAGSLMATIAHRLGYSVVLLEKGKHPRIVIGESSTPLSNLILEELTDRYDLPRLRPLTKWGSWQESYPNLGCGLKRGFSFFHHELGRPPQPSFDMQRQMLVAASPHEAIADTHWYRADFDRFLATEAQEAGVEYIDEIHIESCTRDGSFWTLIGQRQAQFVQVKAGFLIDASGPRGFLHRMLNIGQAELPNYPATSALYAHFRSVTRFDQSRTFPVDVPFPIDDAALHHVFDGGWMWVLRFNNGITSAGVACAPAAAQRFGLEHRGAAWTRLLDALPEVRSQFQSATPITAFTHCPTLPFLSSQVVGEGWAMLPGAAGFIDPMMSTGIPVTLLGISRFSELLEGGLERTGLAPALSRYEKETTEDWLAVSRLMAALYANMGDFRIFRSLTLIYFAAASYSESERRLGTSSCTSSFMLRDHPVFGERSKRLLNAALTNRGPSATHELISDIYNLIEDFDVAGLGRKPPTHCYPVLASDLYSSAAKLGASASDIDRLLTRSGFNLVQASQSSRNANESLSAVGRQ